MAHRLLHRSLADTRGNVSLLTALALLPMLLCAGAAIDYVRIARERTMFQAAVDAAAVAIVASDKANLSGLSSSAKAQRIDELTKIARSFVEKSYRSGVPGDTDFSLELSVTGDAVTLTAEREHPNSLMKLAGLMSSEMEAISEIKKGARPVEIALVMDTTGSMGTTYMNQAKVAARNLLTKIYGGDKSTKKESPYIRAALVPFASGVKLDQKAYDFSLSWIDTTGAAAPSKVNFSDSTWHNYMAWSKLKNQPWNGCVEARMRGTAPNDFIVNDAPPTSGNSLFTPYFAPDEPTVFDASNIYVSPDYGFGNDYIGTTGTPNEFTGISSDTSASSWPTRQANVNKYINRTIANESTTGISVGPWLNCPVAPVVPLTYNRGKVEAGIDKLVAGGSTMIPEGLAWGWRVLSPTEPFTKVEGGPTISADTIAPYNHARWRKIMVLMTDGENNIHNSNVPSSNPNYSWYSAYGYLRATKANRFGNLNSVAVMDSNMLTLCDRIKNSGILLYTVAFRVTSTGILNNLRTCATSPAHYSYAADGVALGAVFNSIGEDVLNTSVYFSK